VFSERSRLTGDPLETVTNPAVIVEILSDATRNFDSGAKFEHYRSIPSLRDYLLIEQSFVHVEHRWRDGEEWHSATFTSNDDVIRLTGVPFALHVNDLFTGTATP